MDYRLIHKEESWAPCWLYVYSYIFLVNCQKEDLSNFDIDRAHLELFNEAKQLREKFWIRGISRYFIVSVYSISLEIEEKQIVYSCLHRRPHNPFSVRFLPMVFDIASVEFLSKCSIENDTFLWSNKIRYLENIAVDYILENHK